MQELKSLVVQAQSGDLEAYNQIVSRFQDVAVAFGCSCLGDRGLAEDAAQEAFVEAFFCLSGLREPAAFPGWLRRIVWKHCDRLTRRKQIVAVSLDAVDEEPSPDGGPEARLEEKELAAWVRAAVAQLPEHERVTTLLFYMGQHSQQHIADFLEVPVGTVKKRLHSARKRLKEKMIHMNEEPSNNAPSPETVSAFISDFARMINEGQSIVRSLARLAEKEPSAQLRQVIEQVNGWVQAGETLSQAMQRFPQVFDARLVSAIQGGETGENLKGVMNQLAEQRPSKSGEFAQRVEAMLRAGVHEVYRVQLESQDEQDEPATVVMLKAQNEERYLPIYIAASQGQNIAFQLRGEKRERPPTYAFMADVIGRLGGHVESVHIWANQNNVFYAIVRVRAGDQTHEIDCRPSDALTLAVQVQAPVYVAPELFRDQGTSQERELRHKVRSIEPFSAR